MITIGTSRLPATIRQWHTRTVAALNRLLSGRDPGTLPPLDLSCGTAFQQKVWRALQKIRCGRTRSYGEVAASIKKPKALRAVGAACGANPIPVLIPCHRVLAAAHRLGGFSGGLDWKRRLLQREGIVPSEPKPKAATKAEPSQLTLPFERSLERSANAACA